MTDAHLHLQDPRLRDKEAIITEMRAAGITRCVVNGTRPVDWELVQTLASSHPEFILPSYGLHPWHTPCNDEWKISLQNYLTHSAHPCIGECGLDRWIPGYDIAAQESAFLYQLDLATELDAPLTIHVLKAWGWFLEILRDRQSATGKPSLAGKRGFLLHSYNGSKDLIPELVSAGAYFSFSGYYLKSNKSKQRETFRHIPLDKLMVETDAPDMLPPASSISHPLHTASEEVNHPANLALIYSQLADVLNISTEKLHAQVEENFSRFFLANPSTKTSL